jgi:hypothetical protein
MLRALKQKHNHRRLQYWHRRNSSRDGLDFSRELVLAMRHNSIYAMADSFTLLPSSDPFKTYNDISEGNEDQVDDSQNGYFQDTRPAASPETKKCVLDLVV